jgi:CHAT domain-containing protein
MICTFYSFKGGVGRSMALANIAELLYRRGLNVLMVDFDLEAPGLERFFDVPDAINKPVDIQEKRGIIDLLMSYKELCSLPPEANYTPSFAVEPIANFITPIYKASDGKGTLSIIQAGCCRSEKHLAEYAQKIRFFDWNDFYSNLDGGHFFNWFREELEKTADIVLVDSRTGFAEISGICAYQLADLVILFVAANEQNFEGTKMMARSLKNDKLIQEGRQGRPLDLLFVPSRVEQDEGILQDEFKKRFENSFGESFQSELKFERGIFLDLRIPYVTHYAYTEQVAVRDFEDTSKQARSSNLNQAYEKLAMTLVQLAPKDSKLYESLVSILKNHHIDRGVVFQAKLPKSLQNLLNAVDGYQIANRAGLDINVQESLRRATTWMENAFNRQSWTEVELAYGYINQASETLLQAQSLPRDKEIWLKETQGLAVQAAYALAKNDNKLPAAVMTIEQGLARLFSESLKHYSFEDIQKTAKEVPLIYIMMTKLGGLALIVQDTITPLWLPEVTQTASKTKTPLYLDTYFKWQREVSIKTSRSKNEFLKNLQETTYWLWQSIMQPIIAALPPRSKVMLIPVGQLSLLPFHAAWTEDNTAITGKRYALDTLTIAYIPNARVLIEAKKIAERIYTNTLLAVEQPEPVTAGFLHNANYEIETIASLYKQTEILKGYAATRDAVLNAMKNNAVLHFSCHGFTNLSNPLNSGLVMAHDEVISLEDLLNLHLEGVRLITLSSCETGIPGVTLPDEIISLSTGFLQAGAAGVVASFWDISDIQTMMIMVRFYDFWRKTGLEPVEALRQAQLWVRDSTNEEKLAYFKEYADGTTFKRVRSEIGFSEMEGKNFAHPFNWATFSYIGV